MSLPDPMTLHKAYGRELAELLDAVLDGDLVSECAAVERQVVRSVGALVQLQQRHRVDERGRCSTCRSASRKWWRLWPRRSTCTVHSALSFYLRQPHWVVLSVIADSPNTRGAS
ncbi:MAG: hypothetical protein M3Z25_12455 [Actinomycetota bacterium]|nr:hypothetical protein [Actinomycetota bacterium]